jgi:hypothetical protein
MYAFSLLVLEAEWEGGRGFWAGIGGELLGLMWILEVVRCLHTCSRLALL